MPATPRPSPRQIFGSCVVLPEPVSPQTMTTWCASIAAAISCRRATTGRSSGYVGWGRWARRRSMSTVIFARSCRDFRRRNEKAGGSRLLLRLLCRSDLHVRIQTVHARQRGLTQHVSANRSQQVGTFECSADRRLRDVERVKREHVMVGYRVVPRRAWAVVPKIVTAHVLVRGEPAAI